MEVQEERSNKPRDAAQERAGEELDAATARLREELGLALESLDRAWFVKAQSFKLSVADAGLRAIVWGLATLALGALAITAALLFAGSIRAGLARWSDGAWWGDLVLALFLFALIAGSAYAARRSIHRGALARAKERLARPIGVRPAQESGP